MYKENFYIHSVCVAKEEYNDKNVCILLLTIQFYQVATILKPSLFCAECKQLKTDEAVKHNKIFHTTIVFSPTLSPHIPKPALYLRVVVGLQAFHTDFEILHKNLYQ